MEIYVLLLLVFGISNIVILRSLPPAPALHQYMRNTE